MIRGLKQRVIRLVQDRLHRWGYHLSRLGPEGLGGDPYRDLARLTRRERPIVFDVGANLGQTVRKFRAVLPGSVIHCFEPGTETFAGLKQNCDGLRDVQLWQQGMGSQATTASFHENAQSEMSSFLPLGSQGWGEVVRETVVDVNTIDRFCEEQQIDYVDILKTDTQGFDFEVLKGAERMLSEGRIGLVFTEISLGDIYQNSGTLDEIYAWMRQHNYPLVTFYRFAYRGSQAVSTDVLFAHPGILEGKGPDGSGPHRLAAPPPADSAAPIGSS